MSRLSVVCVDLGGTNVRLGLVDPQGKILRRRRVKMFEAATKDDLYGGLARIIGSFMDSVGGLPLPRGVAIGFAGLTRASDGYVYFAPNIGGLAGLEIGRRIGSAVGLPVTVANDANCAALGEYWCGAGQGAESLFMFTLGTGIGGGFVVGGAAWEGSDGIAGEIGHTVIDLDGPCCACGKCGCLEALASGSAIIRDYARRKRLRGGPSGLTAKTVIDRARRGETLALAVISDAAGALGVGIANVFNLLNPEVIVVGGGVSRAGRILLDPAVECARNLIPEPLSRRLTVRRGKLGDDAGLIGSAYRAFGVLKRHSRR
jgi:glucokinase